MKIDIIIPNLFFKNVYHNGDYDTLKYVLRSIESYVNWYNNLYIVVSDRTRLPKWLNIHHDRINIVYCNDYKSDNNSLNDFYKAIPGLSKNYIILKQNTFITNYIHIDDLCVKNNVLYNDKSFNIIGDIDDIEHAFCDNALKAVHIDFNDKIKHFNHFALVFLFLNEILNRKYKTISSFEINESNEDKQLYYVHSMWSDPWKEYFNINDMWITALSIEYIKRLGGRIDLYGDEYSINTFKILNYDNVNVIDINYKSKFFCAGKYETIVNMDNDAVLIDHDIFINNLYDKSMFNNDIVFDAYEGIEPLYDDYVNIYKNEYDIKDDIITSNGVYRLGVIGGTKKKDIAEQYIEHTKNIENRFVFYPYDNNFYKTEFVNEQLYLSNYCVDNNYSIDVIQKHDRFESLFNGHVHLFGKTRYLYIDIVKRILKMINPIVYDSIEKYIHQRNSNIDVVIAYCEYNTEYAKKIKDYGGKECLNRYRSYDTLKYQINLIRKNMKFVNNVYVVVSDESQIPKDIDDNCTFIKHDEFMPLKLLPVFNSCCIEMFIPFIKQLSEKFIYFNDDIYPLKYCDESIFFDGDNVRLTTIKTLNKRKEMSVFIKNCKNVTNCIFNTNNYVYYQFDHTAYPLLKSEAQKCFNSNKKNVIKSLTRFRDQKNFNVYLYLNDLIKKKRVTFSNSITKYIGIRDNFLSKDLTLTDDLLYCYNDELKNNEIFEDCKSKLQQHLKQNL